MMASCLDRAPVDQQRQKLLLHYLFIYLFNGLLKNYSNRRQRQNYRNSNNIKSTMYKNKNKIDIKNYYIEKKEIFINNKSYKLIREII